MNNNNNSIVSAVIVGNEGIKSEKRMVRKKGRPSYLSRYKAAMQTLNRINEAEIESVRANTVRILAGN